MSFISEGWTHIRDYFSGEPSRTPRERSRSIAEPSVPASGLLSYMDHNGNLGVCWLRLYSSTRHKKYGDRQLYSHIAVVTDLRGRIHSADSVTYAIDVIATEIGRRWKLELFSFQLIEHYDKRSLVLAGLEQDPEHFYRVSLAWNFNDRYYVTPAWTRVSRKEVIDAISTSLDDSLLERTLQMNWGSGLPAVQEIRRVF